MVDHKKRFKAYLIDIMLLGLIIFIVNCFIPESRNAQILNNELSSLNIMFVKHSIGIITYFNRYAMIIHDLDIATAFYGIINSFFILLYFVIYPFFKNGQTLGQLILKIKVVNENNEPASMNELLARNIIINGLGYMLISLALLYLVPSMTYFIIVTILGFIQFMLVITSVFMVIYKKDKRGLQDIYSKTFVIENN